MSVLLATNWEKVPVPDLSPDFRNEVDEDNEVKEGKEDDEVKEDKDGGVSEIDWEACVLTEGNTSNRKLHDLARKVKTCEASRGEKLSFAQYVEIITKWESASRPFLRSGHDYLTEFLAKLDCVKFLEGENYNTVFLKTQGIAPPEKLRDYPNAKVQHFGSLCQGLNEISKGKPIWLGQSALATLFGCDARTISNWIKALKTLGILILKTKGAKGNGVSTYSYQG